MGESNKTLPPTEKKLQDTREKQGSYLFSNEIVSVSLIGFGMMVLLYIAFQVPAMFDRLLALSLRYVSTPDPNLLNATSDFVQVGFSQIMMYGSIAFGVAIIVGIVANVAQVGWVFSFVKIEKGLNFEQGLNIVTNAKNLFSKRSLVNFLMSIVKVLIICYTSYYVISHDHRLIDDVLSCRSDLLCALSVGGWRVFTVMLYVIVALIPVAGLDYLIQRKLYIGENMMSHDELEREHKDTEGDPHMRAHRKRFAREIVEGDFTRVGNASAVIRNPTHIAIAVRYEPQTMALPYVVAMGSEDEALQIIAEAERHGVPSYVNVPLARAMVQDCRPDQYVPLKHMDGMVKFAAWLEQTHPERVFKVSEFASVGNVRLGDVRRN